MVMMTKAQKKLKAARDKRYNEKKKLQKASEKAFSSMATGTNSTPPQETANSPQCTPKNSELMQVTENQEKYRSEMLGTTVLDDNSRCLEHEDFVRMMRHFR